MGFLERCNDLLISIIFFRNKKTDELKRVLAQGNVDVNMADSSGRTPLYAAVGSDAVEIVDVS